MIEIGWSLRGMRFGGLRWPDEEVRANGAEPVAVLLHGFLDHAGTWEGVADRLPGERYALDHRGHGRSDHNPVGASYVFGDYLADLDALLDVLSPTAPVRLVGHSMGGTMATLYAGARPQRVDSVACLDGLGLPDGVTGAAIAGADPVSDRLIQFLDGVRTPPRHRPMASVTAAAERLLRNNPRIGPEWAARMAARGTVALPSGEVVWSFDPAHRVRSPMPYRQGHHIPLLRRIRCPVLSLHPESPPFAAEDVARLEGGITDLRVETVPNSSHMMLLEEPERIAAIIRDFWHQPARAAPPGALTIPPSRGI